MEDFGNDLIQSTKGEQTHPDVFPQPGVNRMPADGNGHLPRLQCYRLHHTAGDPFAVTP